MAGDLMKGCIRGHHDSVLETSHLLSVAVRHQNDALPNDQRFVNASVCFFVIFQDSLIEINKDCVRTLPVYD